MLNLSGFEKIRDNTLPNAPKANFGSFALNPEKQPYL